MKRAHIAYMLLNFWMWIYPFELPWASAASVPPSASWLQFTSSRCKPRRSQTLRHKIRLPHPLGPMVKIDGSSGTDLSSQARTAGASIPKRRSMVGRREGKIGGGASQKRWLLTYGTLRAWLVPFKRISASWLIWKLWLSELELPSIDSTLKLKNWQKAKPCKGSMPELSWKPKWGATW